jgi:CheY-like chemotaxis protein
MQSLPGGPSATYIVACFGCRQPFDALPAAWCACLTSRRSLVCPHCGICFCRAPQSFKPKLWEGAPQDLWDRAAAEHRHAEELPANADVDSVPRPLVLVVDDDKEIVRIAIAGITRLGYHAIVAGNGEEGWTLTVAYKPELVLADVFMPGIDGREMCRRIKTDPQTSATKVVLMTSVYTASRYKAEAYKEFLADDYLAKPLDFPSLEQLLRKHLG